MAPRSGASNGFALVEALASLVVVSLIGLMILEGVGAGRRVWERIDVVEARGEVIDGAQSLVRDRIEQIYPAARDDQSSLSIDFSGSNSRMGFLASPPYWERPSPLKRYDLRIDDQKRLVLVSTSDVAPRSAPPSTQVLVAGVRRLDIAYFGATALDARRGWRTQWSSEGALPEVIRIRLAFEAGDPRVWPDLIVRPQATIDSGCVLSRISHRCRGRI